MIPAQAQPSAKLESSLYKANYPGRYVAMCTPQVLIAVLIEYSHTAEDLVELTSRHCQKGHCHDMTSLQCHAYRYKRVYIAMIIAMF